MQTRSDFTIRVDTTREVTAAIRELAGARVLVGIPAKNDGRPAPDKIGNAALGYIHEFGSPINNIPPRPFLYPGVRYSQKDWEPYLQQAAEAALSGNRELVLRLLGSAGIKASNAVKMRIQAGIPPPLKRATIMARRRRSKGSAYRRKAIAMSETTPLYDTGNMLRAITWIVTGRAT
jgi:hypothetical protein